jgi:membrane fusion protein (multidrug efflux system)
MSRDPKPRIEVGRDHAAHAEDHDHDADVPLPEATQVSRGRGAVIALLLGGVIAIAFVAGLLPRLMKRHELADDAVTAAQAVPRVEVIRPTTLSSDRALELPGTIQPLEETTIYPRANGYVRRWLVDIGDQVKEGQLLAEIDTPELDAQIEQARADLAQADAGKLRAETNAELSNTERTRYEALTPAGVASKQELEQRRAQAKVDEANIKVASATIASQQASLRRLTQLKGFARITAPFAGTITARSVDRGALVGTSPPTQLFRLAAVDPVRVFIQVPQDIAASIKTGVSGSITVREFGNRVFTGTIARSAGALDDATRTMTTELRVPNPKHELLPGMYVRVAIALTTPHRLFEIPATALYTDGNGTRVAIVDDQNKLQMRKVGIERDTGKTIEINSGLTGDERILRIANAALGNGQTVEALQSSEPKNDPQKAGQK